MRSFSRADRVGGLIQRVLSEILAKDVKDPRLEMVTITNIKMSRDLRLARIYFSTAGGEKEKEDALAGFQKAFGYIKRSLARELDLRYMPDLRFYFDESFEYGTHIDNILNSLHSQNGSDHPTTKK